MARLRMQRLTEVESRCFRFDRFGTASVRASRPKDRYPALDDQVSRPDPACAKVNGMRARHERDPENCGDPGG
jgi:hypothetical protein